MFLDALELESLMTVCVVSVFVFSFSDFDLLSDLLCRSFMSEVQNPFGSCETCNNLSHPSFAGASTI